MAKAVSVEMMTSAASVFIAFTLIPLGDNSIPADLQREWLKGMLILGTNWGLK